MTCPQCNAELPESATYCHTCGSPVRSVTFSYLPAGTPAWPATVPTMPTSVTGAAIQNGKDLEGRSIATTKPLPARPKRSPRTVLIITALFILVPLLGIGVTLGSLWINGEIPAQKVNASLTIPAQTPTQQTGTSGTPTPTTAVQTNQLPTPSSFQTIASKEVGVTLKYPVEWPKAAPQSTSDNSVTLSFHPQQASGIVLFVERFSTTTSARLTSTNDLNQNELSAFQGQQGVSNFHSISPANPQLTVAGTLWDEQDATFTVTSGLTYHLVTISVQHNHLYYNILYYAPAVVYNEAMQKYFQPMLDSIKFQP
jgi:hypothetical protein